MLDPTIRQLYGRYILGRDLKPRSLADYEFRVKQIERALGADTPTSRLFTDDNLVLLQEAHKDKQATAAKADAFFRILWKFAYRRYVRGQTINCQMPPPLDSEVKRVQQPVPDPTAWTPDEMERIFANVSAGGFRRSRNGRKGVRKRVDAYDERTWTALIMFALETGARIRAIREVRWRDIVNGRVALRAESDKAGKLHYMQLSDRLLKALHLMPSRFRRPDMPVFPMNEKTINEGLERILAAAGLPTTYRDKWHKLRRTYVTLAAQAFSAAVAQASVGHSSMAITLRYIDQSQIDPVVDPAALAIPQVELKTIGRARGPNDIRDI